MKAKITKKMVPALLYGVLAGWIVAGILAVAALQVCTGTSLAVAVVAVSAILLLALFPVLRRAASVYTLALRYYKAEYLYDLGNGVEASQAVGIYEKKAKRAASAWMKRKFLKSSFGVLPVLFFALLAANTGFAVALEVVILIGVMVLVAVVIALTVMLYAARHYCYDKFGNIKNN